MRRDAGEGGAVEEDGEEELLRGRGRGRGLVGSIRDIPMEPGNIVARLSR